MNSTEIKKAQRLAAIASEHGIAYEADAEATVMREHGSVWYPVKASSKQGGTWDYFLAADQGSYKGSFPPAQSVAQGIREHVLPHLKAEVDEPSQAEYTFEVTHLIEITKKVVVRAEGRPAAESRMLAHMLDEGLKTSDWRVTNVREI